jgi:hypothetical protein
MPYCTMPTNALAAPTVMMMLRIGRRRDPAREVVDHRHQQEQHELLAVGDADRGSSEKPAESSVTAP